MPLDGHIGTRPVYPAAGIQIVDAVDPLVVTKVRMPGDEALVAPRAGMAYSPGDDGKTAIRAGVGLFYSLLPLLAGDYAANALEGLPSNAIYFPVGDNDTFPPMYLQGVEGVRRDVTIINLSVANIDGYPEQLRRRDPSFPTALSSRERAAVGRRPWTDTTVVIPVSGTAEQLGLATATPVPASIALDVKPAAGMQMMIPADFTLLRFNFGQSGAPPIRPSP